MEQNNQNKADLKKIVILKMTINGNSSLSFLKISKTKSPHLIFLF